MNKEVSYETFTLLKEAFDRQPRDFTTHVHCASPLGVVSFYLQNDGNGKQYYEYMTRNRLLSIIYQVIFGKHSKQDAKDKAMELLKVLGLE